MSHGKAFDTIRIIILAISLLLFCYRIQPCLAGEKFQQVGGTRQADLHGIKVFQGRPPSHYPYTSVGEVEAKGTGAFALQKLDDGFEKLTLKARTMGANAIIEWRTFGFLSFNMNMKGEAVIFEEVPGEEAQEPASEPK